MRKYDPVAHKHVVFKESKMKGAGPSPLPRCRTAVRWGRPFRFGGSRSDRGRMEPRRGSIRPRESDLLQKGKADSQGRWIASGDSTRPCESALAAARVAITAQIDLDGGDAVATAALDRKSTRLNSSH